MRRVQEGSTQTYDESSRVSEPHQFIPSNYKMGLKAARKTGRNTHQRLHDSNLKPPLRSFRTLNKSSALQSIRCFAYLYAIHRQRYSRYLPVFDQNHSKVSGKTSVSKDSDNKPSKDKEKSSRASVESFTKRRSTMNSRAAYDEDEVLRKVLEESKSEGGAGTTDNGTRKKRSRDDSEE